ncbi:MAG: acyl-CoA/acyl-ACP dehydrogenase [Spirochaetales bacterium]|nr:acyl-CoA/acyl-ACP dehydrogenase [Spirochaetales bacterium]
MNFDLTPEEMQFLSGFRSFCQKEIQPESPDVRLRGEIPRSHFEKLYRSGYNGLLHAEDMGGSAASYLLATHAQEILAEHCPSTFFSVGASVGLFGLPLSAWGTPEQKQRYLPDIIAGKKTGCLAVTEPGAGSDVRAIQSQVTRVSESELILKGQKAYITNAPVCDLILVLARLKDEKGKEPGLTCLIVPADSPGVSRGQKLRKMGLDGSATGELFFDDVRLSPEQVLGRSGHGFAMVMDAFLRERLALAAFCLGAMAACFRESRRFSRERRAFGRPIYKQQSVAFMLADMLTRYESARLVVHEAAWLLDQYGNAAGPVLHNGYRVDLGARMAAAKLLSSTHAREVANLAVQIHGGAGYSDEYRVSQFYRDVKIAEIGGGTSEIMQQIIARAERKRVRSF